VNLTFTRPLLRVAAPRRVRAKYEFTLSTTDTAPHRRGVQQLE